MATPDGGTTGTCEGTSANPPCDLDYAAETAAVSGDTVLISGTHTRTGTLVLEPGITLQGAIVDGERAELTAPDAIIMIVDAPGGASGAVIRDLDIVGGHIQFTSGAGNITIERVSVRRESYPVTLHCNSGTMLIRDSEFIGTTGHGAVLRTPDGTCAWTIRNTLFRAADAALFIDSGSLAPATTGTLTMTIRNSIFDGPHYRTLYGPGSSASISVAYSRIADTQFGFTYENTITAPAHHADAANFDFRQLLTSPTRNAGSMDASTSIIDGDRQVRPQGLAADIGPYELPAIPPVATTGAATAVTTTGATLNGTVDPFGTAASFRFEYGPAIPYGFATAAEPAGSGHGAVPVSSTLTGLTPGSTLHYRVVATGAEGTSSGGDMTVAIPTPEPTAAPTTVPTAVPTASPTAVPTASPTAAPTPKPFTRVPPTLSLSVSPKRDRKAPYAFTASGRLGPPGGLPAGQPCVGRVTIRSKRGKRTVSARTTRVGSNCRYRVRVSFGSSRRARARLRVEAAFQGNQLLLPRRSSRVAARLG